MRADYLERWVSLLLERMEPDERVLAQGRAFEPHGEELDLSQLISGPAALAAQAPTAPGGAVRVAAATVTAGGR
jgi:hypothetical protein